MGCGSLIMKFSAYVSGGIRVDRSLGAPLLTVVLGMAVGYGGLFWDRMVFKMDMN